jgi:hypothetical protein
MRVALSIAKGFCTTALLLLFGCRADSADQSGSHPSLSIAVISGDAQLADVGDSLTHPVRFQVTDGNDRPVGGVSVRFVVTVGDGRVPNALDVTNGEGMVTTEWIMGSIAGIQLLEAQVDSGITAIASAATCRPGECYPESRLEGPLSDATLLSLATYDSSGQTVHPDIVHGHGHADGFWLAITPFPGGDLDKENPSIFRSGLGESWNVPDGVSNPLAVSSGINGYNSDPDIIFNPTDQRLWMYYRTYGSQNVISLIRSTDGVHWDRATEVIAVPSHQLVSPAIVRNSPTTGWEMWSVNAGAQGCTASTTTIERRTSADGVKWSTPSLTDLAQPGQVIWHIDVQWIPARLEYWALYNTYPAGSNCATHSLYLARSSDGVHWTVSASPIARSGLIEQFADIIYRSTFLVDSKAKRVLLLISGAKYYDGPGYVWRTASVATSTAELFAIASAPSIAAPSFFYRALPNPEP